MKVLVLGAGAVGTVIADILSKQEEFEEIILADLKKSRAQAAARSIDRPKNLRAEAMNANNVTDMKHGMKDVDMVINATLPRFFLKIMKAALESGTNYMDMATDLGVAGNERAGDKIDKVPIDLQLEQDQAWKDAGLAALLCWGAEPGAVNVFARYAADQLDTVEKIFVRDGDNATIEGFTGFASFWSPDTLIEEVAYMDALVWKDGRFERIPSMSTSEIWEFPEPVGKLRVWAVDHEETQTMGRFIKGCKDCNFMLSLDDTMAETMMALKRIGLVNPEPIDVNGVKIVPRDVVVACMPSPVDPNFLSKIKGHACASVTVIGKKGNKRYSHYLWNLTSHEEAFTKYGGSATGVQTAYPPAIATTLFARGVIKNKGVYPPELLEPKPILQAFSEMGFPWHERKKEL